MACVARGVGRARLRQQRRAQWQGHVRATCRNSGRGWCAGLMLQPGHGLSDVAAVFVGGLHGLRMQNHNFDRCALEEAAGRQGAKPAGGAAALGGALRPGLPQTVFALHGSLRLQQNAAQWALSSYVCKGWPAPLTIGGTSWGRGQLWQALVLLCDVCVCAESGALRLAGLAFLRKVLGGPVSTCWSRMCIPTVCGQMVASARVRCASSLAELLKQNGAGLPAIPHSEAPG